LILDIHFWQFNCPMILLLLRAKMPIKYFPVLQNGQCLAGVEFNRDLLIGLKMENKLA